MKKHAASHGLAVLVCTVAAGILIKIGRDLYPLLTAKFESISYYIVNTFGLNYSPRAVATLILAIVLAAIWGLAFSFLHSDKRDEKKR